MKTVLATFVVCFAIGAVSGFQVQNPPAQMPPVTQRTIQQPDVMLTGCLVQGSSPAVYIFDNAKKDPKSTTEKGVRYLVVAVGEDLDLRSNLNHEVLLTGTIDAKIPALPPNQKPTEKDLPKFNTMTVVSVSDTCSVAR